MQNWQQIVTLIAMVLASGFFSAFIVQFIKRAAWPSWTKLLLSAVVAGIVALAGLWLTGSVQAVAALWGNLTADDVWKFGALVFTAAAAWWRLYFSGAKWAESLAKWPGGSVR